MKNEQHQEFLKRYEAIHAPFVRYCSSKAYGIMEKEDLVQEAILATLKNFDRIKDKDKLLSYLIGVVNNITRNTKRKSFHEANWDEQLFAKLKSKTPSPEIALDIHFLLKAMKQLPAKQQEAILLFEISGFSIKEVSAIQQSSEAATKTRLSRARHSLREMFSEQPKQTSLSATLAAYASILL